MNPATPVPMNQALIRLLLYCPMKLIIVCSPKASEMPEKKAENNESVKLVKIAMDESLLDSEDTESDRLDDTCSHHSRAVWKHDPKLAVQNQNDDCCRDYDPN
jgi:hypothetical protein